MLLFYKQKEKNRMTFSVNFHNLLLTYLFLLITNCFCVTAYAEDFNSFKNELDILKDEVDQIKIQNIEKVKEKKTTLHGYGELHYNNQLGNKSNLSSMDLHRLAMGVSHRFNSTIEAHMKIDFEHSGRGNIILEYAYIDFLFSKTLNFRIGSLLLPIGTLNEFHEPPLFLTVERSYVETYIIPTTWQEGGAGVFGSFDQLFNYKFFIINSLDASRFSGEKGIRQGKRMSAAAPAEKFSAVGRIDTKKFKKLELGLSFYIGKTLHYPLTDKEKIDVLVTLWEIDFKYRIKDFEISGLYAKTTIDDAGQLSNAVFDVIGKQQYGGYLELAYYLFDNFLQNSFQDFILFLRWEHFDTHQEVPGGMDDNISYDRRVSTLGFSYKPIPEIALKADYEMWQNGHHTNWNAFNLGVTYFF